MTWTPVGSIFSAYNVTTFSLTPGNVGDLLLLEVENADSGNPCTGISSSNVTWSLLAGPFAGTVNDRAAVIFAGKVTSTATETVTVSWSGGTPGGQLMAGQEFSTTAGSWALDVQGQLDSARTNTWPSLTPSYGAGELYFGWAFDSGAKAIAGSTPGYTYELDVEDNGLAYNVSCPGSATGPVWGDSTQRLGIMVLMMETPAPFTAPPNRPRGQAVNRASTY